MSDFLLTNLELRESTETGEEASGLSHASMEGMFLLQVNELAAAGQPRGAVTIVHDIGDHGGRYQDFARKFAAAGWAVALPDMRGHGGSEGDRGHSAGIREVVRDLAEIQNHLAYRMPDAPKILVGQGLGAVQCLTFALEQPGVVEAVVLVAPLHEPKFALPEPASGLKKFFKKVGPRSPGAIGYQPDQLTADANQAQAWSGDSLVHDVVTLRAGEQAAEAAKTYLPRVGEAGIPVLVVHGSADPIASAQASRALASSSVDVEIVDGARHHPLQDVSADATMQRILDWIDGHATKWGVISRVRRQRSSPGG